MKKLLFISLLIASLPVFSLAQTAASAPTNTQALIAELQELVKSLQAQIQELRAKLETTQQEVAVVKSEVQFTAFLAKGAQGDEVKQLQEVLKQDPEIYPEGTVTGFFGPATEAAVRRFQEKHKIEARGVIGPKTRAKLNELITEGAGKSGQIPPGLLRAPGTRQVEIATTTPMIATTTPSNAASLTATTTAHTATTTSPAILCAKDARYCATKEACAAANFSWYTVSCHRDPPPAYSCASSYNYCINPAECASQGWYSCRSSCYPSLDACQGQAYVPPAQAAAIPAVPATPAQPVAQTGTTTASAIPATSATPSSSPILSSTSGSWSNIKILDFAGKSYNSYYAESPVFVWDGTGYGVAWMGDNGTGGENIFFMRIDSSGNKVFDPIRLTNHGPCGCLTAAPPALTWNGSKYGIAWTEDPLVNGTVQGQVLRFATLDLLGNKLTDIPVSLSSDNVPNMRPALVWTGSEFALAWSGGWPDYPVYFAKIAASGNTFTVAKKKAVASANANVGNGPIVSLAWNGVNFGAAWADSRDSGGNPNFNKVYFAVLDANGNKVSSDVKLSGTGKTANTPVTAVQENDFIVVWHETGVEGKDINDDANLHFAKLNGSNGSIIIGDKRITNTPTAQGSNGGASIVGNGGDYGIAWVFTPQQGTPPASYSSGPGVIYFKTLDANGNDKTLTEAVSTISGNNNSPLLASAGTAYAVVWKNFSAAYPVYFGYKPGQLPPPTPADTIAPSSPTNLAVTAAYNWYATLTWSKSSDNVGVVGYRVYRNNAQLFSAATSSSLSTLAYRDWNIAAGASYTYAVAAYDAAGNVSASSSAVSVTPVAFAGANCLAQSVNAYSVPALNHAGSITITQTNTVPNGVRTSTTTFTCNNGSLTAGPEAADIKCNSGYASIGIQCAQNTAPPAPSNLTASYAVVWGVGTVSLAWTDNADNETSFELYRKLSSANAFSLVSAVGAKAAGAPSTVRFDDPGGNIAFGSYDYQVRACNAYGCSSYSSIAAVVVSIPPPIGLAAALSATSSVFVSWDHIWNKAAGDGERNYRLYRRTSGGTGWTLLTDGYQPTDFTDPAVPSGTYDYKVSACDFGSPPNCSADSAYFSINVPAAAPLLSAPTGIRAGISANVYNANNWGKASESVDFAYTLTDNTKAFRLYEKKPGASSFSLVAEFTNLSSGVTCGTWTTVGAWSIINSWGGGGSCSKTIWNVSLGRGGELFPVSNYSVGAYEYYVAAVNTAGVEGAPSATGKVHVLDWLTLTSPTGLSPAAPLFKWTVASGWPSGIWSGPYFLRIAEAGSTGGPLWSADWVSINAASGYLYTGPALDPAKTYVVHMYGHWEINNQTEKFASFPQAVSTFTVSAATTTSSADANSGARLAQVLNSLSRLLEALKNALK